LLLSEARVAVLARFGGLLAPEGTCGHGGAFGLEFGRQRVQPVQPQADEQPFPADDDLLDEPV
jgi:hypothetical protein